MMNLFNEIDTCLVVCSLITTKGPVLFLSFKVSFSVRKVPSLVKIDQSIMQTVVRQKGDCLFVDFLAFRKNQNSF